MDPYEVLGVSPADDEETIKKAYRELVKKYHPDKYINNPLADLAAEKMKEINKAYDAIMNKGASGGAGQAGEPRQGYGRQTYNNSSYGNVRMLISQNRIAEARRMLTDLPQNAEWYYLSGLINLRCGWYDQGLGDLQKAARMDPDNAEYRQTIESIHQRNTSYNHTGSGGVCDDPCPVCPCLCVPCFCGC